jgi:hypothetical protein
VTAVARGNVPTNANGEGSLFEIAAFDYGHFTAQEGARAVEDFVRVAMVLGVMRVTVVFV